MNEQEVRTFLDSNEHGVLSLGVESRGYGFPISYTYDEENHRIVLGFVNAPGSQKQEFATATDEAAFTVYDYEDVDSWTSVIVKGEINPLDEDDTRLSVPDVFFHQTTDDHDTEDGMVNLDAFDRNWHALRIDTLSGRRSGEQS